MKERRRRAAPWGGGAAALKTSKRSGSSLWALFCTVLFCAGFVAVGFSTFRLFGASFRPVVLVSRWQTTASSAVTTDIVVAATTSSVTPPVTIRIQEAVSFPDQVLLFLKYPKSVPKSEVFCLYYPPRGSSSNSVEPALRLSPIARSTSHSFFLRCPPVPQGFSVSLSPEQPPLNPHHWDHLVYTAIFDTEDNSTVLFAKGLNLRPARLADPSRYECIFGWGFAFPKYLSTSSALSVAQEIIRCKTPPSLLPHRSKNSSHRFPLVTVRTKGRGSVTLPSVAHPKILPTLRSKKKKSMMCVCTMVRNQARFLREWIMYHSRIGVQRWFIYDNNSEDDIEPVIESIVSTGKYNLSLHSWPWIKTQEAGFAHCALRARDSCEWVSFIDVDEFLYLPTDVTLHDVLKNYTSIPWVGELRTACYSFGPSGRKTIPSDGVIMGYTCRMNAPERHKSIVRPRALNPSLINAVHHFHLKEGMKYVNMEKGIMVINHYKYQVWEVFKEKFYRRVATYVADWQDEENVGSKDRAPGLGTKAVEPPDWSSRFCEVTDTGLRDWVSKTLIDPKTRLLPW